MTCVSSVWTTSERSGAATNSSSIMSDGVKVWIHMSLTGMISGNLRISLIDAQYKFGLNVTVPPLACPRAVTPSSALDGSRLCVYEQPLSFKTNVHKVQVTS